uniref:Uncharacterized protein LOC102804825 n=1 Tax=Saccoglossus kowalevskii TaxID=10224 RepID=A0ABM0MJ44_SACKO|nr:PREDICTED: uncharacterized protein LOC102804825 [Saccoglossus kowalevskii]
MARRGWLMIMDTDTELMTQPLSVGIQARLIDNASLWPLGEGDIPHIGCNASRPLSDNAFLINEHKVSVSWQGGDPESGIYDYLIGLSSTGDELASDILSYTATHSHAKFSAFHLQLQQGTEFYVLIRAINGAMMTTTEKVGPIIVDVTPPVFTGTIYVEYDATNSGYLIARWNENDFVETEDEEPLSDYSVAVGDTPYGTQLLDFTSIETFDSPICDNTIQPSCVAIPVDSLDWDLHGDHIYYISIKVKNIGGLSVTGVSSPYKHVVGLPIVGVVWDTVDPNTSVFLHDVDYQSTANEIHSKWYGFARPNQIVTYELAIGTSPGDTDISDFIYLGTQTEHSTFNLELMLNQIYFVTIRASSESGFVDVSSDGILIIQDGDYIEGVQVFDGVDCTTEDIKQLPKDEHHDYYGRFRCEEDIDYQSSTTIINAHWDLPNESFPYITHFEVMVQRENTYKTFSTWNSKHVYDRLPQNNHVQITNLDLSPGAHYRTAIAFCHPEGCFQLTVSNGFWVISYPPISEGIDSIEYNQNTAELRFSWMEFINIEVENNLDSSEYMAYYEWTLSVDTGTSNHGDLLYPWERIIDPVNVDGKLSHQVFLPSKLVFSECIQLAIRGNNKAGLYSTVYKEIYDCESIYPQYITPNTVIDAVGDRDDEGDVDDIYLAVNDEWVEIDAEYTPSKHKLSAVWPTLTHYKYLWKVIADESIEKWGYVRHSTELNYDTYLCDSLEVLTCGSTKENYVNIDNLDLEYGRRYYICMYANETHREKEDTVEILPMVSECSNGVTVDWIPPEAGTVWIGRVGQQYQTSTSHMYINWMGFTDIEESGAQMSHDSGIQRYEYALGSFLGGVDVQDFVDVGVTNWAVAHTLHLLQGQSYYATLKAIDFVGLSVKSISSAVIIDTSIPIKTNVTIDVGGTYHHSTTSISAAWNMLFYDKESGVSYYEWAIGSTPAIDDIFPFTPSNYAYGTAEDLTLREGHSYFISVRAYNGAGMSAMAISWAVTIDTSPPEPGIVYDGERNSTFKDFDYQFDTSKINAYWEGFIDPHSGIVDYIWKIGTCRGCDDVMQEQHVGLVTEMEADHLNLKPGFTYYTTVTACNSAGMCTSASSDGVTSDISPPIAGMVFDGPSGKDWQYQASRKRLAAHWYNFHDYHSKLSHYEWRAGVTRGGDDIVSSTPLHITESLYVPLLESLLPQNATIYTTIKAYDNIGLAVEATSNGIKVDVTPPHVIRNITVNQIVGSIIPDTQVWRSFLRVTWQFDDTESPIERQILSVFTGHQSEVDVPSTQVSGIVTDYIFTDLSLNDGDTYYVKVVACNAAKLCSSSGTRGILVDSSQPTVGTFAAASNHSADLSRHQEGYMTYVQETENYPAIIKLAWLGFSDIHSGITHYYVTVGSQYSGRDLTPDGPVALAHENGELYHDEGAVQTGIVEINRNLVPGEYIYITLWAVNGVGMRSMEAHDTFEVVQSNDFEGILVLLRRCSLQTCQGDCTCAPEYEVCHGAESECSDVTGNTDYDHVDVYDIINYRIDDTDLSDVIYSPSRCALAAVWKARNEGIAIERYEWSAGTKGDEPGTGIFNPAHDRIWYDVGLETYAILLQETSLLEDTQYVFYVKAWYDENTYAIFQTNGVTVQYTPPYISDSRKVKDLHSPNNTRDKDYTTSTNTLTVHWKDVFIDDIDKLAFFEVSVSTCKGGEDVRPFNASRHSPDIDTVVFTDLNLQPGVIYYSNVIASNHVNLRSIASSDGIKVDYSPPTKGIVYDGLGLYDADYQNSTTTVSANWHGFSDLQSYVDYYLWCVGSSPGLEDILSCQSVGLKTSFSRTVATAISTGTKVYSKVMAVNAAGLISEPAISDGVIIDATPPEVLEKFNFSDNLLNNPSFEYLLRNENDSIEVLGDCVSSGVPAYWVLTGKGYVHSCNNTLAQHGNSFAVVVGEISQNIVTTIGEKYRLRLYASYSPHSIVPALSQEGFVQISRLYKVFKLYQRKGRLDSRVNFPDGDIQWHEYVEYFHAEENMTTLIIGSLAQGGISLDYIDLRQLSDGKRTQSEDPNHHVNELASPIHITIQRVGNYHTVQAAWDVIDAESPIVDNMWAIGTTYGSTQLQGFTSIGRKFSAICRDLVLSHETKLYVTIVVTNMVGLESVIHSDPITIDLTPPDLCCAKDGNQGDDIDYINGDQLVVHWRVDDPESGVESCEVAVGFSPGTVDVSDFHPTDKLNRTQIDLTGKVAHGETIYSTIRCHNYIGASSTITTDGVTQVHECPDSREAFIDVTTMSETQYARRRHHQSLSNMIDIAWHGFEDVTGISHYQCKIVDGKKQSLKWTDIGRNGEAFATLYGLHMHSYATYEILLRAVNHVGYHSDEVTVNVTIETQKPIINKNDVSVNWLSTSEVEIDWTGLYASNSSMVYELTVGTVYGGSDVVKWQETMETRIRNYDISMPSLLYDADARKSLLGHVDVYTIQRENGVSILQVPLEHKLQLLYWDPGNIACYGVNVTFAGHIPMMNNNKANSAPIVMSRLTAMIPENGGTMMCPNTAVYSDNDNIVFQPTENNSTTYGECNMTSHGLLMLMPCLDCFGTDSVEVTP